MQPIIRPPDRNTFALWKTLILGLMLVCFLGLHIVEASHLHQTAALERDCPVCQASSHPSLDLPPPALSPFAPLLFLLFILAGWHPVSRIVAQPFDRPNSRAPPVRAA